MLPIDILYLGNLNLLHFLFQLLLNTLFFLPLQRKFRIRYFTFSSNPIAMVSIEMIYKIFCKANVISTTVLPYNVKDLLLHILSND